MKPSEQTILTPLQSIQRRIRLRRCGFGVSLGLCIFPFAYLSLAAADFQDNIPPVISVLTVLAVCLVPYTLLGWFYKTGGLSAAARLVDKHYGLSDRLLTAVSLLRKEQNNLTAMEQLQIEDAAGYAEQIIPAKVLPFFDKERFSIYALMVDNKRFNNYAMIYPAVLFSLILCYCFYTAHQLYPVPVSKENSIPLENTAGLDIMPQSVDTLVSKMRHIAAKQKNAEKTNTGADKENKLSSGSEMSEAMRKKLRHWDTAAKIASMNDIADALNAAEATKNAAEALKEKRYSDAANELNQMNSDLISTMSNKERKEVADMLQKAIQKTKDRGQTPLAETMQKIETSLKMGEAEGFNELADESKKLAMQQQIEQMKENQANTLSYTQGSGDGGKNSEKSNEEGKNFGTGEAGNPTGGQATQLENKKERQELSGIIGEGESEFEKANDTAPKKTERDYQELQYVIKKMPEDVLNKEPLPLEQRQTLRRYFDLLHQEQK